MCVEDRDVSLNMIHDHSVQMMFEGLRKLGWNIDKKVNTNAS
jgi:hypothetical protein